MEQQHMLNGAGGNMPQTSMQRPQAGNVDQQIYARIIRDIRQNPTQLSGWQSTYDIKQRAQWTFQLVSSLRLLSQSGMSGLNLAQGFEMKTLLASPSKEIYGETIRRKLDEITAQRQQMVNNNSRMGNRPSNGQPGMMQNGMTNMQPPMGNMQHLDPNMKMPNTNMQQFNMQNPGMQNPGRQNPNMQNPNMQHVNMQHPNLPIMDGPNTNMHTLNMQPGGGMGPQNGQSNGMPAQNPGGFPQHLQRPMQPSPITSAPVHTMDPAMLQQPSQTPQVALRTAQTGQLQNSAQGQGQGQSTMNAAMQAAFISARRTYDSMSDDTRTAARTKVLQGLTEAQRSHLAQSGGDPLLKVLITQAQRQAQNKTSLQMSNNGNTMAGSMGTQMQQRSTPQTGNQNFDLPSIVGQQANAMKLQQSGEQVVPASIHQTNGMNIGNPNQSIDPQMLGNMGSLPNSSGQSNIPNHAQIMQQQKNVHLRELQHKQLLAQQQASQQALLRGQPGGLNPANAFNAMSGGQAPSPAMPMLNRPLAPPGQNPPATPQQTPQQPAPATPVNPASQIAQQHQNMLNRNGQQPEQQQQQQQISRTQMDQHHLASMLSRLPENMRQGLLALHPQQRQAALQKLHETALQQQQQQNQRQQAAQANVTNAPQSQQPGQQMQNVVRNPSQAFNSQPTPNQQSEQAVMTQKQRLQTQAMDMRPFPKLILQHLNLTGIPPQVQSWIDLKRYVHQNRQSLPQNTLGMVGRAQNAHITSNAAEQQAVMRIVAGFHAGNQALPQRPIDLTAQQPNQQPASQAPAAPMAPPAALLHAQGTGPNQPPLQSIPAPTPQEIHKFRQKVPAAQGMTEDQIRAVLTKHRLDRYNAQRRAQAGQNTPMQQIGAGLQGGLISNGQPPQQQPPRPQQSGQVATQRPPQQSSNDDVVEIPAPLPQPARLPQQSARMNMTRAEYERLAPERQREYMQKLTEYQRKEALLKAQTASGSVNGREQLTAQNLNLTPAQQEKIAAMIQQARLENPRGPPIVLDPASVGAVQAQFKKIWGPLSKIDGTFATFFAWPNSNLEMLKKVLRARVIISHNADQEGNLHNGYCSLSAAQLKLLYGDLGSYLMEVTKAKAALSAARVQAQAQATQPPINAPDAAVAPLQPAPSASAGSHRKTSSNNKPPPAPTVEKSFDWAAANPAGIPKYDGHNELTPDKLKFPPTKKRKTDSQASTPVAQTVTPAALSGSPGVGSGKMPGPELLRRAPPQAKPEAEKVLPQPKYSCNDPTCDPNVACYLTEELLKQHQELEHSPVADPLAFMLEEAAKALGVDADGKPLPVVEKPVVKAPLVGRPRTMLSHKKVAGKPGTKPSGDKPAAAPAVQPAQTQTMDERLAQKAGIQLPAAKQPEKKAPEAVQEPPKKWNATAPFDFDIDYRVHQPDGLKHFWDDLGIVADPYLEQYVDKMEADLLSASPPTLTPSSENDSPASRASDLSPRNQLKLVVNMHDWDPFGDGNLGVPESLVGFALEERKRKEIEKARGDGDVVMGGAEASEVARSSSRKRKTPNLPDLEEFEEPLPFDLAQWLNPHVLGPVSAEAVQVN